MLEPNASCLRWLMAIGVATCVGCGGASGGAEDVSVEVHEPPGVDGHDLDGTTALDPGQGDAVPDASSDSAELPRDVSVVEDATDAAGEVWQGPEVFDTTPDATPEEDAPSCEPCAPLEATAQLSMPPEALVAAPARTRHNALKGFMTSYLWGAPVTDFPDQMEFIYLPMGDLWGPDGQTLEAGLEPLLAAAASRDHHVVLRIYLDYPTKPSGLPVYLSDVVSCQPYDDHGGGCSPDYEVPALVEAMVGLLTALGDHYDGDPRLGALQVGLLGFWGEWHTWPYPEWFASTATQEAVLQAAHDAFDVTQLQVRRPAANSLDLRVGFHDDSFAYSTMGDIDWFFLPSLVAAGGDERWREVMIGGELRPELQPGIFEDGYALDTYAQDVVACVDGTHASYLLNYSAFNEGGVGYQGLERERAEAAALHMGYQLELDAAELNLWALEEGTVEASVTVTLAQTGVAPFYYGLFLSLVAEGHGELGASAEDLRTLLPGQTRVVTVPLGRVSTDVVTAPIMLHLTSPILSPGQRVLLATTTPETADGGPTALRWSPGCQVSGESVALGKVVGASPSGCPCVCDVDGNLRTCGGEVCP